MSHFMADLIQHLQRFCLGNGMSSNVNLNPKHIKTKTKPLFLKEFKICFKTV